jgi:hypothetical protein
VSKPLPAPAMSEKYWVCEIDFVDVDYKKPWPALPTALSLDDTHSHPSSRTNSPDHHSCADVSVPVVLMRLPIQGTAGGCGVRCTIHRSHPQPYSVTVCPIR